MLFIDAIFVKLRDGQVTNRPIYVAIGVTVDGERDILGLWAGQASEGGKRADGAAKGRRMQAIAGHWRGARAHSAEPWVQGRGGSTAHA